MKQYKSNITKGYCKQWTKSKAVMEFSSNMIDGGDYTFNFGEDTVEFINFNTKLTAKALLLGLSDKANNDEMIGMHGCGLLQSMAALLAQDVEVVIYNADDIWTPSFEHCEQYSEEVLIVSEEGNPLGGSDYKVVISNLTEEDIDEIKQRSLIYQDREILHSTSVGDIISNDDGEENEVFVGGVYITQSEDFKYTYNFKIGQVILSQDRNMIDSWELKKLTAKLISRIDDADFVKEAIEANSYDTQLVTDRFWTEKDYQQSQHSAVDIIGQEFVDEHEATFVTSEYSEHEYNQLHNTPSVYIDNKVKVSTIKQSTVYKESVANIEVVEQASPCEVVEKCKEEIMEILCANMKAESCSEVLSLLDSLVELSDNWGGTIDWENVPF